MRQRHNVAPRQPGPSAWRRGRSVVVGFVVTLVAAGSLAGGWFAAGAFRSPEQIAAAASPPPPSQVTATVGRGDLSDVISIESTIGRDQVDDVPIPSGETASVVTANPLQSGEEVRAGAVVLEINGEPVFALPGTFPLYRDIVLGDTGPDIRQLQLGLQQAGMGVAADGVLGPGTRSAIEQLYRAAGYRAPSEGVVVEVPRTDARNGDAGENVPEESERPADTATSELLVVRAASFVNIDSLPAFLTSVPEVGAAGEDVVSISVAFGELFVFATVTSGTAALISEGMEGAIELPDGTEVTLVVASIASPEDDGTVAIRLTPIDQTLPEYLLGESAVVSLTRQLAAEDALLVPTRAVSSHGAGQQTVFRMNANGSFSEVQVQEIAALGGRSAIAVTGRATLNEGDEVLVE